MSKESEAFVRQANEVDDFRDAGLTTPEDVVRYDDIVYGDDPEWQILDVYRPRGAEGESLPVIVSVHGGGWVYGDKERYQYYCLSLAQRGFAVINYTYRLAPMFKFPSSVIDTNLVMKWMLENAEEYGLDTRYVFGVGDSAGGHLLSLYTAICTNKAYAEKYPFTVPSGFVPTAVALNCGKYTFEDVSDKDALSKALMGDLLPGGGTAEELDFISSYRYVTEAYPPVFLMTCNGDFLKNQAPCMEKQLFEKDIFHEFHLFGTREEVLSHVFHLNMRSGIAARCNDLECDFFRSFIK